ncbi:MAG: iron ABC transporter permease [Oscillospiraceae bacterium]|nr:iron ABC transporter permease [Oscillospiraceae bacterium]
MKKKNDSRAPGHGAIYITVTAALVGAAALSLLVGAVHLSPAQILCALFSPDSSTAAAIVRLSRLPRTAAAMLAGAGLSIAGVLLQGVTDNHLASPNIIGVNAGAGLFTILTLHLFPTAVLALPFAAFFGAFAAASVILLTAGRIGFSKTNVILAGIALTSILNAAISFVSLIDSDVVAAYNFFSVGGLSGIPPHTLAVPAVLIALSWALSLLLSRKISVLCLGDALAVSLGVRVRFLRAVCIILACAAAASVVSFAGLLGFVGLVVPHIARRLVGESTARLLLCAPPLGAAVVLLADTLGRTLFAPTEIPVGIVMAFVGAPFFLALLLGRQSNA